MALNNTTNKKRPQASLLRAACGCFLLFFILILLCLLLNRVYHGVDQLLLLLQGAVQLFDILQNKLCMDLGYSLLNFFLIFFGFRKMYDDLDAELPPILFLIL